MKSPLSFSWSSSLIVLALNTLPVSAQIAPDGSLPTSVTSPDGLNFTIDNGTLSGGNLFHSFQDFSVPTNGSAFFNNGLDVQNIFSRVTGGNISNIDGLLRANGGANLFLLNPNGIVFGPNASLNIGGSFFGTTANSIQFADGVEFSATNPTANPLLTISVPVGLQMGQNPGAITVQGTGYQFVVNLFAPIDRSQNPPGLKVGAGQTLALIGGAVNFSGGIASANGGGHIEVGSVGDGQVGLNLTPAGWVGDYSAVRQFNDIHLTQQSLLDASGSNGSIQVQGRDIKLSEGSSILLQNLGTQTSGGITVQATGALNLTGTIPNGRTGSFIYTENVGMGQTGDIHIAAAQLSLQEGGAIASRTFVPASGGNIAIDVSGTIAIDGFASADPIWTSAIGTLTFSSANAGNLTVSTGSLRLLNGASLGSASVGSGQSGTVRVNAQDAIEIAGNNPITLIPSALVTSTNSSGNANSVFVNTDRLVIREGGVLGTSTVSTGSAGSVTVNASDSIEIRGRSAGSINPSRIVSTAEIFDPVTQATFRLPAIPSGDAGSLTINTPSLRITDGAFVTVKNDGPGIAGDVQINANSIGLDNQGSITASTASGNGGDIRLNLQDSLLLRHGSKLSVTAAGTGNGGNLSINTPVLVGLENSDIIANADLGNGGNIQINTQGIFGLENRPELTPESDISASSQFGVSGSITINNPNADSSLGIVELPQDPIDPSQDIGRGCGEIADSQFIASGRGGIPESPDATIQSSRIWNDLRDLPAVESSEMADTATVPAMPLVEATTWVRNDRGQVELVAMQPVGDRFSPTHCNPLANQPDVAEQ
jgi:filamentous hemagglutinin family protein